MSHKKWIAVAVIATATISSAASASDRGVNTALGAVAGALIGNVVGGQNAAVVGGVLGAVVGNSVGGRDEARYYGNRGQGYYGRAPVYYHSEPVRTRPYYRDGYGARYDYRGDRRYERIDYDYGRGGYRR